MSAGGGGGGGGGVTVLKKGSDLLPHPGMLTSQPEEIRRRSNNIAEKMERLFKVSRNSVSPESVFETPYFVAVYGLQPEKSTKSMLLRRFEFKHFPKIKKTRLGRASRLPRGLAAIKRHPKVWSLLPPESPASSADQGSSLKDARSPNFLSLLEGVWKLLRLLPE